MKKMRNAVMLMGIGALVATVGMKMMNSNTSVNDLMKKEKRMLKQFKKKLTE
jgi:hypothetical protein